MSLLNYWHDYIKEKIEKVQSDVDNINNFTLKESETNINLTNFGADDTKTTYLAIRKNEYFLGIESITLSEGVAGNINVDVDRFYTNSDGKKGFQMTITNNTAHVYNGTVTVKLVCLAQA